MKKYFIILLIIAGAIAIYFLQQPEQSEQLGSTSSATTNNGAEPAPTAITNAEPEVVQTNLDTPWEIAFLPDGDMLITERAGKLKRFGNTNATITVEGVREAGEGGLLGMALHPSFGDNNFVYLYFTTANLTNKVVRYKLNRDVLENPTTIIENVPGANNHDGGRIAFGPDQKLYITTGDAQTESNAQNTQSLAGKILRINNDGTIPNDNPFGNAVYSYGHRNPQGLAWDDQGQLWATEHGRSGVLSGYDELNRIEKGKNYGWPDLQGDDTGPGKEKPVQHSGNTTTWAPADIVIVGNTLYFGGLRGQSLYHSTISGTTAGIPIANFTKTYGRIRALAFHDGYLYFSTSNQDGRGSPNPQDDKILRLRITK